MKRPWFSRGIWWLWIYFFRFWGLPFRLAPLVLPHNEGPKLRKAARGQDVLIIYNGGGWGDATLEQAGDFAPIVAGIQQTLQEQGYRSQAVAYRRTLTGLPGRLAGIREQYNSFQHTSQILAGDIESVIDGYPGVNILVAGFSIGGGLSGKTLWRLQGVPRIYGIAIGVPGWIYTYRSPTSLVLDNGGLDPLCAGDSGAIAMAVFKAPVKWWQARKNGRRLSAALSIQIPHHEYTWASPEVRQPILEFLKRHFPAD